MWIRKIILFFFQREENPIEEGNYSDCPLLNIWDLQDDSFVKDKYKEEVIWVIGKGTFGKILMVERVEGQEKIKLAVKIIEIPLIEQLAAYRKAYRNELTNLLKLPLHPNIMNE